MKNYFLHIPHSGTIIPEKYLNTYYINNLDYQIKDIADLYTDELFSLIDNVDSEIFPYSRLFIDVERFEDELEKMNKIDRGWFYKKDNKNKLLRNTSYKKEIYPIFKNYHINLENKILKLLQKYKQLTIIDCHSFSNKKIWFNNYKGKMPDICIGVNNINKNINLINKIKDIFKNYKIKINEPYSGSYYPLNIKNQNLKSIMIEINKKLYMNEDNFKIKHKEFKKIQNLLKKL